MIVCVCKAVSERHIHGAIDRGVVSLRDLSRELGVGSCCGKCAPMTKGLLRERLAQAAPPPALMGLPSPAGLMMERA